MKNFFKAAKEAAKAAENVKLAWAKAEAAATLANALLLVELAKEKLTQAEETAPWTSAWARADEAATKAEKAMALAWAAEATAGALDTAAEEKERMGIGYAGEGRYNDQ